jgi:hypothetical protein
MHYASSLGTVANMVEHDGMAVLEPWLYPAIVLGDPCTNLSGSGNRSNCRKVPDTTLNHVDVCFIVYVWEWGKLLRVHYSLIVNLHKLPSPHRIKNREYLSCTVYTASILAGPKVFSLRRNRLSPSGRKQWGGEQLYVVFILIWGEGGSPLLSTAGFGTDI